MGFILNLVYGSDSDNEVVSSLSLLIERKSEAQSMHTILRNFHVISTQTSGYWYNLYLVRDNEPFIQVKRFTLTILIYSLRGLYDCDSISRLIRWSIIN